MTQYPNSDKLTDTAILFEFSEWLGQRCGIIDLTSDEDAILNTDDLIYKFLGIDKAALEQERKAMVSDNNLLQRAVLQNPMKWGKLEPIWQRGSALSEVKRSAGPAEDSEVSE